MLDTDAVQGVFARLTDEINADARSLGGRVYSLDEVAYGFIRVANEAMARPIRNLTTMRGHDVTAHALACFGGAGPQHCCAIARLLGMKKIYINKYSGILSAFGLSLADEVIDRQEPFSGSAIDSGDSLDLAKQRLMYLEATGRSQLESQGYRPDAVSCTKFLNCRYSGTDTAIMIPLDYGHVAADCVAGFKQVYMREYGFDLLDRSVLVDDIRVRVIGKSNAPAYPNTSITSSSVPQSSLKVKEHVSVYFEGGRLNTPVYHFIDLHPGDNIHGPAIIIQNVATVIVEPLCAALITTTGDIEISLTESNARNIGVELDPVYLSVFSHRFMSIAEQMGRTLQRTSISVNIKERLDFSCALFDNVGALVANAPHLPVHLGGRNSTHFEY
jgi:5-oxoprolinase (ATP-hydrolysing)